MAGWTGLEPATFCVTGRRSNQLSYHPDLGRKVIFRRTTGTVKREFEHTQGAVAWRHTNRVLTWPLSRKRTSPVQFKETLAKPESV